MTTEPISSEQLRREVEAVLSRYGMTLDEFVASDIDDLDGWELRDLWLMTRDALTDAA